MDFLQVFLIIVLGGMVGLGMAFLGQTGQGIILPFVYLLTGDILLSIATNALNDLIVASCVSIPYFKRKQVVLKKELLAFICVGIVFIVLGVTVATATPVGNALGWLLPAILLIFAIFILKNGFPTVESVKIMVKNIARKILKERANDLFHDETGNGVLQLDNDDGASEFKGLIPAKSKLYYGLLVGFGIYAGFNSGLTGANSGVIITIVLVLIYGYTLKQGVGTSLVLGIMMCSCTFIFYQVIGIALLSRTFFVPAISFLIAPPGVVTGMITAHYIQKLSPKAFGRGMAVVMLALAITVLVLVILK